MKILELRFKNLNSLYGEWIIDFTAPEYISNGIFALTGPTGAGKSTVLDAVCLALYGATPRLGRITKTTNEIMSRRTGECYAEVLFESQAGRFRCHFGQHRAHKKPRGELQAPRHEIAEGVENGRIIENQLRRVARVIEEKTGMDFERFTRSILLAQGGFDTFLRADTEQKSKILEQITGTEIYSEISRRVHERQRDEREKLNLVQAEISGIEILEPEQEKEIQLELEANQKQEKELGKKLIETGRAITWVTNIEGLKKEILGLADEAAKLQTEIEGFKPERSRLKRAMKAASLDGLYAKLTALRREHSDDSKALRAEKETLPELEKSAKLHAESLKAAEALFLRAREALKAEAPLIQKVRSLDQKLEEQKNAVSEIIKTCDMEAEEISRYKQARVKEQEKRTKAGKILKTAEQYLRDHAQDEWLISGLAGIKEQLGSLAAGHREILQKKAALEKADSDLEKAVKKLGACKKQCAIRRQKLEDITGKLRQAKGALNELLDGRLLREYRAEKESLQREKEYMARIAALEDHRAKLEDGKPCPLCGSTRHPFAAGNIPVPDDIEVRIESLTELISRVEDQETAIKQLEKAEANAHKNLNDSEKLETSAVNDKEAAEKALLEFKEGLEKLRAGSEKLRLAVSEKLQPLGITEIPEGQVSVLLDSLNSRLKAWQEQISKKNEIEKQITAIDSETKGLDAVIETRERALAEKRKKLDCLKKEYIAGLDERKKLYGSKIPDNEELCLNRAIADAEANEKKARDLNTTVNQKLVSAKTRIETLKKRIEQREPDLKQAETEFAAALGLAGFADETRFLKARLTKEEYEALSFRAGELDKAGTELDARKKDREARLAAKIAEKITRMSLEELEKQYREYEESLKNLRDAIAGLRHKLIENEAAGKRVKEKQAAIDARKKECSRWEKLHWLIGSADGRKYRNFAQGLTFELMVSHANRQLQKMTDRYLLIRDDKQPLELNVVDNYQAGEIRSTRNLSGGESFIVSLTLALGLSKMASRKVRVDSLFLDEGFGTLDEEALETALETLSMLHQDNKLIGIISHVPALKERISTQINIVPLSGGKSTIKGPGCRALTAGP